MPTLHRGDHCDLALPTSCPGEQCLCRRRSHGLLLGYDPHRRPWHSLNLLGTPSSIAAAAATLATFASVTAAIATVSAGDNSGEHRRRPDQRTRQHRRHPHCPGPRHLQPHSRAQHHQERRPRGSGGRLGRAECTGELFESAPCADHQPGLVGRRATDRAQHHGRLHQLWRRCLNPGWHGVHLIVYHQWEHSYRCGRRCLRRGWHRYSGHLIEHLQWEHSYKFCWTRRRCLCLSWHSHDCVFLDRREQGTSRRRCLRPGWHSGHLIVHHQWEHSYKSWRFVAILVWRRCLCPEWLGDLLIVHHHWQHSSRFC